MSIELDKFRIFSFSNISYLRNRNRLFGIACWPETNCWDVEDKAPNPEEGGGL